MNQICVKRQPLVLDHLQKVPVVHDPVKNRTQRESVMPTERCRKSDHGYAAVGGWSDSRVVIFAFSGFDSARTLDVQIEVRKDVSIGGCSGVVCFVYDYGFQPCRIKLL
jgi:hypothetical protein